MTKSDARTCSSGEIWWELLKKYKIGTSSTNNEPELVLTEYVTTQAKLNGEEVAQT